MKRGITLLVILLTAAYCTAQSDSLYQMQQRKIESMEKESRQLKSDVLSLKNQVGVLQSQMTGFSAEVERQQTTIEGINSEVCNNTESISQSNLKTEGIAHNLHGKTIGGIVVALILLCVSVLVYLFLRKRISKGNSVIEEIEQAQKRLQEESVKLDSKLVELLDGQLKMQRNQSQSENGTPNHTLALKIADEITRIETNLSRMDASVRGYKQLMASVKRIKDNFMANGYELVEMLGKTYNEGMRANVEFVIDEEIEEGKRIITLVTKPQVNYRGEMIQKASITVSENK